jgi:hypothetical protein
MKRKHIRRILAGVAAEEREAGRSLDWQIGVVTCPHCSHVMKSVHPITCDVVECSGCHAMIDPGVNSVPLSDFLATCR